MRAPQPWYPLLRAAQPRDHIAQLYTHDIDEAIFMANRVAVMTARPGRIKSDIAITLPHPRHYTVKTTPEFSAYKAQLTEEIRAESIRAAEMGA